MRTRTFLPRPEYPRPDRQRAFVHGVDWINLNGAWEFQFDGERVGIEERWFAPESRRWPEQILVPFCWESLAAWGEADAAGNDNYFSTRVFRNPLEVNRFNYRGAARYEVGWYRRSITIPASEHWQGKRIILTIGAADFFTDCWCNGQTLGRHEGGFTPFEFDLTDALEPGVDGQLHGTLVLRVEDPMENHEQPVGKQWGWYSTASGIWQTVFVEPRAPVSIERFEIVTDLQAGEVRITIFTTGGECVAAEIVSPAGQALTESFPVAGHRALAVFRIEPMMLWDPHHPHLYRLKLILTAGAHSDVVHSYFGMRSLAAQPVEEAGAPSALSLNGEPIYLRGALYQSYHAEGIYTAGDVQVLQDDIAYAKRFGFDMLRVHIKIDDPLLLYYADTMGILLMADFPNFGEGGDTALGRQRFETMMRRAIERDFNHPSIIAWCLFNETWGFGGQSEIVKLINPTPPKITARSSPSVEAASATLDAYRWVQSMWRLAKTLDPSRLVEDMSVVPWDHLQYYGHGDTDVNSWHFYTDSYERAREHIQKVVEETYAGSSFNYVPGFQQGSQPLINSEYGGVGALDGDVDISWSFKFLTNELRRHGKLSAYIFTELHDVEWERNGFLNYDRTPKEFGYDPTIVNRGDVLPIDAPPVQRCAPLDQVEVNVFSAHYARRQVEKVTLHWRLSGIDSLGWMHDDIASGATAIPFNRYRLELAESVKLQMPEEPMLCTLWVRAVTPDGYLAASNYIQFFVDDGLKVREHGNGRLIFRAEPFMWSAALWSGACSDREEAEEIGACYGEGHGYFEWEFPVTPDDLRSCSRIRVLCEASARRSGTPQTDSFAYPTVTRLQLNGIRIKQQTLPNHPHDARGALSYLRNGKGAYGYLAHATAEGPLLTEVLRAMAGDRLVLRCEVPEELQPQGGMTIYGRDCGRYPIPPTVIIE